MARFGSVSIAKLQSCDPRLQAIAHEAIKHVDFSVIDGHRGKQAQDAAVAAGNSKTPWPHSQHNKRPSRAFDFAPYPIDWSDRTAALLRYTFVAGVIKKVADDQGVKIRFGWDWNRNLDPRDETFLDYGHVELDEP